MSQEYNLLHSQMASVPASIFDAMLKQDLPSSIVDDKILDEWLEEGVQLYKTELAAKAIISVLRKLGRKKSIQFSRPAD